MIYRKCKGKCGKKYPLTRKYFYQTGKKSKHNLHDLFHWKCKKCYNSNPKKKLYNGMPIDERYEIKRSDSRFRRDRVSRALKKKGLK